MKSSPLTLEFTLSAEKLLKKWAEILRHLLLTKQFAATNEQISNLAKLVRELRHLLGEKQAPWNELSQPTGRDKILSNLAEVVNDRPETLFLLDYGKWADKRPGPSQSLAPLAKPKPKL